MLDIKLLRNDLDAIVKQLARRGFKLDAEAFQSLEDQRKILQSTTQDLQSERNNNAKLIGKAKASGEDIQPLLDQVADLGEKLKAAENQLRELQSEIDNIVMGIPNLLNESVPEGKSEEDNVEIRRWGEPTQFDFEIKDHVDLGASNGWMDFESATKADGFAICRNACRNGTTTPCLDPVHARYAYPGTWLSGSICTLYRESG